MLAIKIVFVVLVFSVMMSVVTHSGIFTSSGYYEGSYLTQFNETLPENISTLEETQQYSGTMNIISVIFSTLTFNWIYAYVPSGMEDDFAPIVAGLYVIGAFLIVIAFLEIYMKRSDVLGG